MPDRPPYDAGHAPAPTTRRVPEPVVAAIAHGALAAALEHEQACWEARTIAMGDSAIWVHEALHRWTEARGLVAQLRGEIGVGTDEEDEG